MEEKQFSGRILVRVSPELHKNATECASKLGISLNDFINESIKEGMDKHMVNTSSFDRVIIGEEKLSDLREAIIVTQNPWFMEVFNKYKVYFFNPNLGRVRPMQYILCYETTKTEDDGSVNNNKRHIAKWGKVKEIIFDIDVNDYKHIPELEPLTQDDKFWSEIKTWGINNVVIFEEVGNIDDPLPLKDRFKARYLVNKTTSFLKLRNAKYIDDLL